MSLCQRSSAVRPSRSGAKLSGKQGGREVARRALWVMVCPGTGQGDGCGCVRAEELPPVLPRSSPASVPAARSSQLRACAGESGDCEPHSKLKAVSPSSEDQLSSAQHVY